MPVPSYNEMLVFSLLVCVTQLAVLARFFLRLKWDSVKPRVAQAIPVSVIIPCKGLSEELADNVAAFLEQDYPAGVEYVFVTPAESDPAFAYLTGLVRKYPSAKAKVLSSDAVPVSCSEQILNMLHGVRNADVKSRALVFVPCDVRVPAGWLGELVAPLADPAVGAATAPMLYQPDSGSLCKNLRCIWTALGIPYLELAGCVVGHSFAVLTKNFSAFGIEGAWSKAINDDLTFTRMVRKAGKKVVYAYRAFPTSGEKCGWRPLVGMFNKWMVHFKYYNPPIWAMGASLTIFKVYSVFRAVSCGDWLPLVILLAGDILHVYAALTLFQRYFGSRFFAADGPALKHFPWMALTGPFLLQPVYAANFLVSCFSSTMRWGGYTYRIKGPWSISVSPP
ncbi:MAG TPA: hypothetical protein DCZ93_02910 [Elusimicrobia bacterium]|nr:hypothetical protein [Elusimicrobiota bacterium]